MGMLDELIAAPPPLRVDEQGVLRVGKTRVTLDTVIGAYKEGCGPEEIVYRYPSLNLIDVHGAIAIYLTNKDRLEAYLAKRREEAEKLRKEIEERFPPQEFYEKMLARRKERS